MPLLTVFLREQGGFNLLQIGIASSVMSLPILFSPVLITLFADRNIDSRRILAVAFSASSMVLTAIYFSNSIELTLLLFFFHGVCFVAMLPLQDGFYFSLAEQKRSELNEVIEYPKVRLWGSIGFMVPSLILFMPLKMGADPGSILPVAVFFCLLTVVNSFSLPTLKSQSKQNRPIKKIPTSKAIARLFSPEGRWLAIGIFFALFAAAIYYAFIANYMDEVIKMPREYIGIVFNIGVAFEVLYTVLMPWMQRKIGLKAIICLGLGLMSLRMLLLALFPNPAVAVVVQVMHGLEVMALFVASPVFINRLASDEYRNSMQGVYTMCVAGVSRVLAGVTAGFVVMNGGMKHGLFLGAGLAFVAFLIITILFQRIAPDGEK